ncbi:hypothetical protein [Sporosalibacterium faouarense]|uniref:hypothetical protein n=1 Tax=Sporosalibacterium faouarense TaxID=516123 RepID=UPI00141C8D86|nr:hypothetical protein [Sporosalibacterium faouarense]MTI49587.1 hypothetical protein [Bacillota bacterium]
MLNSDKIVDILIQKKFKQALEAKKEGKLYDFRKELKNEIVSRKEEIINISEKQWSSAEKLLDEIEENKNIH